MADAEPAGPVRYTVCIWRESPRGEDSVLWYSGAFAVELDSRPEALVITVHRRAEAAGEEGRSVVTER